MMKLLRKIRAMSRRKKIFLSALLLVLVGGGVAYGLSRSGEIAGPPPEPPKFYSQLTGVEVDEEISKRPLLAAMIENSEEARPQSGLDSAGIVFETVTEGGITRYLALFQEELPKQIGPVRSLRPAFVNWLAGYDAAVAHAGGSTKALGLIEQLKIKSLGQFTHPEPYLRDPNRAAPHDLYGKTDDLRKLQKQLKFDKTSDFKPFTRSDDGPAQSPTAKTINLDFSGSPLFAVEFRYDPTSNSYKRFLAGSAHLDALTKKQITVKNVVVLRIAGNHSDNLKVIGSGEALLFKDGNVVRAKWQKPTSDAELKIVDEKTGNDISLNRGDTWISAVPTSRPVNY